jgi:hypothetical protein
MKLKNCPKCGLDLPKEAFTSTRAKYCINCTRIRQLEQQLAMQKRAFEKAKAKQSKAIKKPKKRKKNSPRKILENKLDTISAKVCRMQGHCTICGKRDGVLNAHHFKSRTYKGVRWHQPNLICLCVHCHTFSFKFSAHKTPKAFKEKMIELRGQEWFEDIENRAINHTSWTTEQLETMLEIYQQELKKLE